MHAARQTGEGRRDAPGPAERSRRSRSAASRPASSAIGRPPSSRPVRIFGPPRSCRIATSRPARAAPPRARARTSRACDLVRAVREVEPDDVGAGGDERVEHGVGVGGGTDRRDDLRLAHVESIHYGPDRSRPRRALPERTRIARTMRCSTTSRAPAPSRICRSSTPRSARCCACWRRRSAPGASSKSARRRLLGHLARRRAAGRRHADHDGEGPGPRARSRRRTSSAPASPIASAS